MLLALAAVLTATVLAAEPTTSGAGSHGAVTGTVTLTDARGERFEAPGVELVLACATTRDEPRTAASDQHGMFRFTDVRAGGCSLSADLQGFGRVTTDVVVPAADTLQVEIDLDVAPVDSGVRVVAESYVFMAHKTVQLIIGRILTDEAFRDGFIADPDGTFSTLREMGYDLTRLELDALSKTNRQLWQQGPDWIDARLQRCA